MHSTPDADGEAALSSGGLGLGRQAERTFDEQPVAFHADILLAPRRPAQVHRPCRLPPRKAWTLTYAGAPQTVRTSNCSLPGATASPLDIIDCSAWNWPVQSSGAGRSPPQRAIISHRPEGPLLHSCRNSNLRGFRRVSPYGSLRTVS